MSLAALLISGDSKATANSANKTNLSGKQVDEDLDALFRSNAAPASVVATKPPQGIPIAIPAESTKTSPFRGQKRKRQQEHTNHHSLLSQQGALKTSKRKKVPISSKLSDGSSEDDDENDEELENNYLLRRTSQSALIEKGTDGGSDVSDGQATEDEDDDEDAPPPMHETHSGAVTTTGRTQSRKKTKYVPADETSAQRDARTVFVGNISIDVAQSKSLQKQLKRHFISRVPGSKIDSIRFRSVAFASATSASADPADAKSTHDAATTKQRRQQERAAQWRGTKGNGDETSGKASRGNESNASDREDDPKKKKPTYFNQAEKKRVAFIKRDFHKEVDAVNAYIVFSHTPPDRTSKELDTLHPFEAARLAVEKCDGTIFLDRTIRVDRVGRWREACDAESDPLAGGTGDPRATVFAGNLDFAAKEEDLRAWFEGVLSQERGPRENDSDTDEENGDAKKPHSWVQSVRIVRDKDTQLGKGFAYVRFADRECVDEVLALEATKLKFAKRKLRVQRCKVVSAGGVSARSKTKVLSAVHKPTDAKRTSASTIASVPQGDPSLGVKLAGLSKDERKAVKAADVDRVKRRLAKKKLKAGMDKAKEKSGRKTRDRERKTSGKKTKGKPVNKNRMRSEKSVQKRNTKK